MPVFSFAYGICIGYKVAFFAITLNEIIYSKFFSKIINKRLNGCWLSLFTVTRGLQAGGYSKIKSFKEFPDVRVYASGIFNKVIV